MREKLLFLIGYFQKLHFALTLVTVGLARDCGASAAMLCVEIGSARTGGQSRSVQVEVLTDGGRDGGGETRGKKRVKKKQKSKRRRRWGMR